MASSISAPPLYYPDKISRKSLYANPNPRFLNHSLKKLSSSPTDPTPCRCQNRFDSSASPNEGRPRWDSVLQDVAKSAVKWWNDYVNSNGGSLEGADLVGETEAMEEGDWDWERWRRHFEEVEEQERLVSILKSQLADAVYREDYQDAAKLKVANAAAARNDTVGQAISLLNRAVKEERYQDAAFIRDHAGAGLVGWWAGKSEDSTNPYGVVVRISAEHGRYVARSYSSRQFASGTRGIPLFEVYFTVNDGGEYKHQAVYLKQNKRNSVDFLAKSWKPADVSSLNPLGDSNEVKNDLPVSTTDDLEESEERDEDSDVAEGLAGIQSILRDMIPGVKVKVLKVMGPGKVDRDLIFKSLEQDMEEEEDEDDDDDGEEDEELEVVEDSEDELKSEIERDKIIDDGRGVDREDQSEMAVKVVIGGLVQKLSSDMTPKDILRVPARLESRSHKSFSFCIKKDEDQQEKPGKKGLGLQEKASALPSQRSINLVMSNLVKVLGSRERIPMEVLKNVGELINLTLSQAQNRKPLSGSTIFNRIEIPATSDPLNGLYIGSHGLNTSEIIHLRRKFGHWEEDGGSQKSSNLGFYEYVEALKLTGDPYVPAGQIAFRAKVGKRNQLPHKGIIPEEFGVVARYRGQGRLAEPGFLNPRWVDGELVILDGKHVIGGPVVGFVYWAPEYHFLVFFNRLRLQD